MSRSRGRAVDSIDAALREAESLKQELDDTYARYVEALREMPIAFQGDVHKYMCIRMAGFLEQFMLLACTGYLRSVAHPRAARFGLSFFRKAPNLTPEAFEALWSRLGEDWGEEAHLFMEDGGRREILGSLMAIRNIAAHGANYRGSISSVAGYRDLVNEIYSWARSRLLVTT